MLYGEEGSILDVADHSINYKLNIMNSNFINNNCSFNDTYENGLLSVDTGGGIMRIALHFFDIRACVLDNSITIKKCSFLLNTAYYGGAVSYKITKEANRITASNTINFTECIWYKNKARTGNAIAPYVTYLQ